MRKFRLKLFWGDRFQGDWQIFSAFSSACWAAQLAIAKTISKIPANRLPILVVFVCICLLQMINLHHAVCTFCTWYSTTTNTGYDTTFSKQTECTYNDTSWSSILVKIFTCVFFIFVIWARIRAWLRKADVDEQEGIKEKIPDLDDV